MNSLSVTQNRIPAMSEMAIDNVRQLQEYVLQQPQTEIPTLHLFHAGMYARTIILPANTRLVGALIKIATIVIVDGDFTVCIGDDVVEKHGHHIFAASAHRKQAFIARTDTYITMIFKTDATNVDKAEEEFTDEFELLFSRADGAVNHVTITGE